MQRICKGKKVLDCFTHMGTFALNAGIAGASEVTGLDISEYAVAQAEANARLNHLENTVHFRCANVLDELPKLAAAGEKYDVVILDPPAFTKSREATKNAIKGYREINMKGLKLVKEDVYKRQQRIITLCNVFFVNFFSIIYPPQHLPVRRSGHFPLPGQSSQTLQQ